MGRFREWMGIGRVAAVGDATGTETLIRRF